MKEQIKIRKSWLINPETKVEPIKSTKRRFQDNEDNDWKNLTGYIDKEDLQEFEEEEDDKQE